jgi:hypothetical protein
MEGTGIAGGANCFGGVAGVAGGCDCPHANAAPSRRKENLILLE